MIDAHLERLQADHDKALKEAKLARDEYQLRCGLAGTDYDLKVAMRKVLAARSALNAYGKYLKAKEK